MKKIIGLFVLVFAVTFSMSAQEKRMGKKMNHPNFTPQQQATLHTKKMTLALDLTQSQQRDVHQFFVSTSAERKAMMVDFKANRVKGTKLSDTQKYDRAITRLDKQIAHKSKMRSILNKDQYEKWSKIQGQKMRKHGKKSGNKQGKRGSKHTQGKHKMNRRK